MAEKCSKLLFNTAILLRGLPSCELKLETKSFFFGVMLERFIFPALLHLMNLTIMSSLACNSLIKEIMVLDVSFLVLRKKLQQKLVASLSASNQNFELPNSSL